MQQPANQWTLEANFQNLSMNGKKAKPKGGNISTVPCDDFA